MKIFPQSNDRPQMPHPWRRGATLIVTALLSLGLSACVTATVQQSSPVVEAGTTTAKPESTTPAPIQELPTAPKTSRLSSPTTMPPIQVDDAKQSTDDQDASHSLAPSNLSNSRPPVVALVRGAEQDQTAGELELAADKLERALRIDARDPVPWQALARIRLQQRNYLQAIQLASRSNTLLSRDDPMRERNWTVMAAAYDALGESDKAAAARDKIRSSP